MGEAVVVMQDKTSNACCAELTKKHSKLLEKYANLLEIKNKFRKCTELVQQKYDVVERENRVLQEALEELKVQANIWNNEKEKGCDRCVDLEDEISALKEEAQLMKQNQKSTIENADEESQRRFNVAEKEIKHLKELLVKEWEKVASEKTNTELERKKADEALKKVGAEKMKLTEAQNAAKEIQERLNVSEKEIKHLKELIEKERERAALEEKNARSEKKKADEALKKVEAGKKKVSEAHKAVTVEKKKAEENRLLWEKLKTKAVELNSLLASERSKTEAAEKKMETEKQRAIRDRKRADVAEAISEEQRELAEANLKKAMLEKDRADDLKCKLEDVRAIAEKLEEENKILRAEKITNAQADKHESGKGVEKSTAACEAGMRKNDAQLSEWMEKILSEKDRNIVKEKKRADSEEKKAKKQKNVAEAHKKFATEQKHRADQLYNELESYKLRLKELQKELLESVSRRINADNAPLRNNEKIFSEADTVKLLKKRLKLEKMLVKHANETAKVEALRTNMLHRELFHLKQEYVLFQQRLDLLDKSFLHDLEGTHHLKKIGKQTSPRGTLHRPLVSGIESRMNPPYRGSNQKMLQSSAINSCSETFSDRTLVGSQERRMVTVTTSDKPGEDISNLNPTISRLFNNENTVAKAGNSMKTPIKDSLLNKQRVGYSGKKRILAAVDSIENSYSKSEKLHRRVSEKLSLLHGLLNDQKDEHDEILKDNSIPKLVKSSKRRKTSCEGMKDIRRLEDYGEPKSILDSDIIHPDACLRASPIGVDVIKCGSHCKVRPGDKIGSNQWLPQEFDEIAAHDYMKLLDLDDPTDESAYRRAIAMPLSPLLPDVEVHGDEKREVDNSEMLVDKNLQEGSTNERDNPSSISSFNNIDMEKYPIKLVNNGLASSQLQPSQDSDNVLESTDSVLGSGTLVNQIHVTDGKLDMSELPGFLEKENNIPFERGITSINICLPRFFVLPSVHKENFSILRILQRMHSCMQQCSFLHSTETFLRGVLHYISKAEDLPMKEKACVFFSLVLHRISEVGIKNLTCSLNDKLLKCFDSVTQHIRSALADPVLRRTFMESCDLFELFAVIENFILHGKVFVCDEVLDKPEDVHRFETDLVLNGNSVTVSEVVASSQLLVAGGFLLASLCFAFDQIGFVCEMSCNIITMQKFERTAILAILHAFGHACGSKYFTLERYVIAMTVVKSLVVFLEKQTSSESWLCSNKCAFSDGALSTEDVALFLLENLRKHCRSECWRQDLVVPRVEVEETRTREISGLREAVLFSFTSDENLCDFTDILSSVEILAYFMDWDWIFDNLIGQICVYLESHLMEGSSTAIIVLLGQLGSLGVGACGYENARVKKLRGRLSALVCDTTFRNLNLSAQVAIITSLFGLTSIKFEEIVEDKVGGPAATRHSIPASFVRDWFFGLSYEQQTLFRLHQSPGNEEQS